MDKTNPSYYRTPGLETIDVIEAWTSDLSGIQAVCSANVIKYISRWHKKNGIEDLKKARWYLDKLIASEERKDMFTLELGESYEEIATGNIYMVTGKGGGTRTFEVCIRETDGSRSYIQTTGSFLNDAAKFKKIR